MDANLILQGLGAWLLAPMQFFSFLGTEQFYLFIAPALLWCLDAGLGLRLGLGLMVSASVNSILKLVFHSPRPYWINERVQALAAETSFGIPSGHAQNAVVVWGILAAWIRKTWVWVVAILLMLMIGLSRLYLGVHFLGDVVVGWLVGGLILWAFLRLERPVLARLVQFPVGGQILAALIASLLLIFLGVVARLPLSGWSVPDVWVTLASRAPDAEPLDPLSLSRLVSQAGTFFGLAMGGILLKQLGWFDARGPALQRVLRYLIGLAGVLVLYIGLGPILPRGEALVPYLLRYLFYALIGLWVTLVSPQLFIRLNLAKKGSPLC
jgi:membrane-associated phospholipid phosphatase